MPYTFTNIARGPVRIVALGWALTTTFLVQYVLCWLVAVLFPNANLTHAFLALYSTAPAGSIRGLAEGIIWNVGLAWIAALIFGTVYNSLAPSPQSNQRKAR